MTDLNLTSLDDKIFYLLITIAEKSKLKAKGLVRNDTDYYKAINEFKYTIVEYNQIKNTNNSFKRDKKLNKTYKVLEKLSVEILDFEEYRMETFKEK